MQKIRMNKKINFSFFHYISFLIKLKLTIIKLFAFSVSQ
jgi:hypothetical protein